MTTKTVPDWASKFLGQARGRQTVINWPQQVQRVVDDYLPHVPSIAHAVQKDAIQNSWDARKNRKGTGWACSLELVASSSGRQFFTITDSGTTGLTGDVLQPDQYQADMPESQKWARFESLAFTHKADDDSSHLGARGQGKFILVGASTSTPQAIFYDTLRDDGVYRLGARFVEPTESPVFAWDGDDGRAQLAALGADLEPLTAVGTRVIIPDPHQELVDACRDGSLARWVAETWWPILLKQKAEIRLGERTPSGTSSEKVSVPQELDLPESDTARFKIWKAENLAVTSAGESLRIKRVHFAFDTSDDIPLEVQGVALVRGGMVVMRLPFTNVPAKIGCAVTGYAEFDTSLDLAMKALEAPTHYEFNLRRGFGFAVKQAVTDQLVKFGAAKLGVGAERSRHEAAQQRDAERRALEAINRAARRLGLVGRRGPGGGGGGGGGGGAPHELLAAELGEPTLPSQDTRRVEFGQPVKDIRVRAVNHSEHPATVRMSLYVTRDDAEIEVFIKAWELWVLPKTRSDWSESFSIVFSPDEHFAGPYVLRAKLLVIDSPDRPKMFEHRDAYKFWVAEDPPLGGIFEDVDAVSYVGDSVTIDAEAFPGGSSGGWKFQYNLVHPAYLRVADDPEELTNYLFQLMAREMVYVDLKSDPPKLFSTADLDDRSSQQRRARQIVSRVLFDYFD